MDQESKTRAGKMAEQCCSYRGSSFYSQHPNGGTQPSVTLVSGGLTPSPDLERPQSHTWGTCTYLGKTLIHTYTHKNLKKN